MFPEETCLYMGEAGEEEIAVMAEASRKNAAEYYSYFEGKHSLRDAELTVILSKEDLFARNWKEAERNRNRHGTAVREPVYLNSRSH